MSANVTINIPFNGMVKKIQRTRGPNPSALAPGNSEFYEYANYTVS